MVKSSQKPRSLSDEEKKLVRQMKQELIMAGVPKDEIPRYVQQELTMHRMEQKKKNNPSTDNSNMGSFRKALSKIKEHAGKVLQKILQKTIFRGMMDQPQNPFEMNQNQVMNLPLLRPDDPDWESEVNQHSSSLQPGNSQKRIIVDMDDDDE